VHHGALDDHAEHSRGRNLGVFRLFHARKGNIFYQSLMQGTCYFNRFDHLLMRGAFNFYISDHSLMRGTCNFYLFNH
jgi:hypothetical protein